MMINKMLCTADTNVGLIPAVPMLFVRAIMRCLIYLDIFEHRSLP